MSELPQKYLGGYCEILAAAHLMREGYDVFRNIADKGPADIIAMHRKTGAIRKIDVKTTRAGQGPRLVTKRYRHLDIEILYVNPETGLVSNDILVMRVDYKNKKAQEKPPSEYDFDLSAELDSRCRA